MNFISNISIRSKLILLTGVAVLCALALSAAGILLNDVGMIRAATLAQLETQARMLEFNSDAVLAFADQEAARNLLESMSLQPAVEVACLLDENGVVFAAYAKRKNEPLLLPKHLDESVTVTADGHIEIIVPVRENAGGEVQVGTLYIRANTNNVAAHLSSQAKFIAGASVSSLLAAVAIAALLQRAISRPILELAEAADMITRREDYEVRVQRTSRDELGTLYDAFNRMLDALKASHDQVANQAKQLSQEINVRRRVEVDLVEAKEAAEMSNRAKSEFLANMSHEIRTPLTGILGFTDVLMTGGDDGEAEKRLEYLHTIHSSGKHLLALINDILDLSKIESGRFEFEDRPCRPEKIVGDVVRVLQARADEQEIDLKVSWEGLVPETIHTDEARIRQAVMNVIGNSIKFTPKGAIEVVGQLIKRNGRRQMQIQVIDTGIGIAKNKLNAIFEPFVQGDTSVTRRFGGTGLGLAISRRIARGLGGDLIAESELGRGSKFTLTFDAGSLAGVPLVAPAANAASTGEPAAAAANAELPPIRVLLVEDGATNRKLIKLLLERAGATVATAENGELGCQLAAQQQFDVILMDMQMPVLDGYSATERLRDAGMTLPIVALTAHAMTGDREKCLAAGCNDYLTKPINPEQLFEVVRQALDGQSGEGNSPRCAPSAAPAEADESSSDADCYDAGVGVGVSVDP